MKIGVYLDYILILLLVLFVFCNISLYILLIPLDIILIFLLSLFNGQMLIKRVIAQCNKSSIRLSNHTIYIVNKKVMGNHNVAVVGYKKNYIFIEEEVNSKLSKESVNALIMHEIGHINQKNRKKLFLSKYISEIFICIGTHNAIYGEDILLYVLCIFGMLLFLMVFYFERKNEYLADEYALSQGIRKEDLIAGLIGLNRLNLKNQNSMTHPALKKRINRIESFDKTS